MTMTQRHDLSPIRLGISTCPNDTFAFHALMQKKVDWLGLDFQISLLDIQQLNSRLFADQWDVAKASFHAALLLTDRTVVLPSGSALGFGVGPLLLASNKNQIPTDSEQVTLCPGEHTTATLLFKLFYPQSTHVEHCVFSDIMPRLKAKQADFGVCIHEGRFTWEQAGLDLVEDLGTRWERETESPLPLGGILASRQLDNETIARVQSVIKASLEYGLTHPEEALTSMRLHAQEFEDEVLMQHVDLYVNQWTQNLGVIGKNALSALSERAKAIGLLPSDRPEIEIWG
ncbi:1,4-dihydroxy-6-naphthoate synthase [Rubripirellula sp.]|nr:1,4-dihydroxy-6-naphthoate synthase [Rubripirellula sp.]MDB4338766.1 1,4-dihydroxy-6-naphthoate synthase [Rubripirellula sp.]